MPPDPVPPGIANYSLDAFLKWQTGFRTPVYYEAAAWTQIHDKLVANFSDDVYIHDLIYMCGWVPEFSRFLTPLDELLTDSLTSDLPESSFGAVTWNGEVFGAVSTLSLLTLYYNTEHLEYAGIAAPPSTWEELKESAEALTRDGRYGWISNYGTPEGIGGTTSYWMVFLQQAGGTMYGDDGTVAFNDAPGVDALQFMIDLIPYTDPDSFMHTGIVDATNAFKAGSASMMMNWPFMWNNIQHQTSSSSNGRLGTAVLPAGSAGSASIDGADSWTISAKSPDPELAMKLMNFYLDKEVQVQQALETGWLPIRRSALRDPELQATLPHAAVLLEQSRHPYNSFLTPDYAAVTGALGIEIQAALRGEKTAANAISNAAATVSAIISERLRSE